MTPAERKRALVARNAALRSELARDVVLLRAELAPALHRGEQVLAGLAWARAHAPLLGGIAAFAVVIGLRLGTRRPAGPGLLARLGRLGRLARLALTVGALLARFTRPGRPPSPSDRPAAPWPRRSS